MSQFNQPLQRLYRIFSGKYSEELWKVINKVQNKETHWALTELGYHCQDLELQVHALESRLAKLEDR